MLHDVRPEPDPNTLDAVGTAHDRVREALDDVQATLDDVVNRAGPARGPMKHLIGTRGKLLRPRLVLLASAIVSGEATFCPPLAAAAELIHSASLLHDDVIDEGAQRRGLPSARVVYSNSASVLAGDHCLTDAVDLIREQDTGLTLAESLQCVRNLVDGELLQLQVRGELTLDESHYRQVCELKTASLFVWAARAGARYAGGTEEQIEALGEFARNLGIAFQIRDDLLDFVGTERFGKNLLDDLREGRSTLPVILAARDDEDLRKQIAELYAEENAGEFELRVTRIAKSVRESSAIDEVTVEVRERIDAALELLGTLPDSPYRALLTQQIELLRA